MRHPSLRSTLQTGIFATSPACFEDFEAEIARRIRDHEFTTKQAGDVFEVFVEALLTMDPLQEAVTVWPSGTIPDDIKQRLVIEDKDIGLDGAFQRRDGSIAAYQAKFRSHRSALTWGDLSTFVGQSDRADKRLVVTNSDVLADGITKRPNVISIRGSDLRALTAESLVAIRELIVSDVAPEIKKCVPALHQVEAIAKITTEFETADRATALMACGTGKTLTALWVAEDLKSSTILVLLPSLALVRQTLIEWATQNTWGDKFRFICVCSDETVANSDEPSLSQSDVPFQITTDPDIIRGFLSQVGVIRVVFSTYHSSHHIQEACFDGFRFDLGVFDEAHKTTGATQSGFSIALEDAFIPIRRRLFMTATSRTYSRKLMNNVEIRSMDNVVQYGRIAYSLSFREAARRGIICDYKVVIAAVTRTEMAKIIAEDAMNDGGLLIGLGEIAGRVAIAKTLEKYGLKKAFSFHSSVAKARNFVERTGRMGLAEILPGFKTFSVSGAMTVAVRSSKIEEFKSADRGVMSNARCLTEGVDVPAVDLVAFIDPKKSKIDIVQAIGRALRKSRDKAKKFGYILLPLFIDNEAEETIDAALKRASFEDVWYVLKALMEQDDALTDVVDRILAKTLAGGAAGGDDLSGFVEIISDADILENIRLCVDVGIVDECGALVRIDGAKEDDFPVITSQNQLTKALEMHFACEFTTTGRRLESQTGISLSLSVSNSPRYRKNNSYFNKIGQGHLDSEWLVLWSSLTDYALLIPTSYLRNFFKHIKPTEDGSRSDWNPITIFGNKGTFIHARDKYLDVTHFIIKIN